MNQNQEKTKIDLLEDKINFLCNAFQKCLGISFESDLAAMKTVSLQDKSFSIALSNEIQDIHNFDVILETLNQLGNERGIAFKKGTQKQNKGESPYQKSIICKLKDRNKTKHSETHEKDKNNISSKVYIKNVDCPVYYKFSVDQEGQVELYSYKEDHNHSPYLNVQQKLTDQMIIEISKFNRISKVCDIRDFLENKYDTKLDYMSIYHQFRTFFRRFGKQDCQNFINYLELNSATYRTQTSEEDASLCKLIFSTQLMKYHYEKYGDIILIDTTYNTNYYSVPLVVISGVDGEYRNVLFGLGFINNEESATYSWILEQFSQMMNNKKPKLIVSDQDKALTKAISEKFIGIPHRFCAWHVSRTLKRQFGYISQDYDEIKQKIFSLPYLYSAKVFDQNVKDIENFLKEQKLEKSHNYLQDLLTKKEQWARSYYESGFDAGISTTSRVESWNAVIKRYLNSHSEISDIIEFITQIENSCFFSKELKISNEVYTLLEYDNI